MKKKFRTPVVGIGESTTLVGQVVLGGRIAQFFKKKK